MNKQKTDWVDRVEELLVKCEQLYFSYKEYSGTLENLCKSENDIKDFISKTIQQSRTEIIKEIEGIVGEDEEIRNYMDINNGYVHIECDKQSRNQLRKEIRERLLLIK